MRRPTLRLLSLTASVVLGIALYWLLHTPGTAPVSTRGTSSKDAPAAAISSPPAHSSPQSLESPSATATAETATMSANVLWVPGAAVSATPATTSPAPGTTSVSAAVALDVHNALNVLPDLAVGDRITLPLLHGDLANAIVSLVQRDPNGTLRLAGTVENQPGASISLILSGTTLSGRVLLPDSHLAYTVATQPNGQTFLKEDALSAVICDPLPRPALTGLSGTLASSGTSTNALSAARAPEAAPPILSSRPSATAILYLDFDGETVIDPDWNNGNTITAAPSLLSSSQITEVWKRVSEDYAPFDVDVTTDVSRYNAAPAGKRMRCIITPTAQWYDSGQSGGVAYRHSFARGDDDFTSNVPCWAFESYYPDPSSTALIVSHELGHTLGLKHDGRTSPLEAYYSGHSNWGPIMGAAYYASVLQWSKGEYANADNQEDDLAIIAGAANGFGYLADDFGDTRATASPIAATTTTLSGSGLISTTADVDFFSFTVPACSLTLSANSPSPSPNLDIRLEVQDSSGTVLVSADPYELSASLEIGLTAGTYYIKVEGVGRGNPLSEGYSDYGSLGQYTLTGAIGAPQSAPSISTHPTSHTAYEGESQTSLNVSASGTGTLRYQWIKDGADLPASSNHFSGVQSSYLSIYNPTATDAGVYSVRITNLGGSVTSSAASLTISAPPPPTFSYYVNPSSTGYVGASFSLNNYASGVGSITYQWEKDGTALANGNGISGATSSYLAIEPLALTHSGSYRLKATNAGGSTYSAPCVLTVAMPPLPTLSIDLADINVIQGLSINYWQAYFSFQGSVTYQWYKDGQPITGATSSYYQISSVQPSHAGKYSLVATNATGSTSSREASLSVTTPAAPVFTRHPAPTRVYMGNNLILSAFASGLPAPRYQWKQDGVLLPNYTSESLSISNAQAAQSGVYTVTATNAAGSATSNAAVVTVVSRATTGSLSVLPQSKSIGAARLSYPVTIVSNKAWTTSGVPAWISLNRTSGSMSGEIEITVAPNAASSSRTATLAIGGLPHTITQAGAGTPVAEAWGLGSSDDNQLGVKKSDQSYPQMLLTDVKSVAANISTSYFLKNDGSLWAMGSGSYGQLGNGSYANTSVPLQIASNVTAISACSNHLLFLKADQTLWGCGQESYGELAGSSSNYYSSVITPRQIAADVATMSIGEVHAAFVKTNGSLWVLGYAANGRLGMGNLSGVINTPVQILTSGVKSVSCGGAHTLILKTDGTLWGTGQNFQGELGLGHTNPVYTPVQVATNVSQIHAFGSNSAYITADGSLRGMGYGSGNILGSQFYSTVSTPYLIASDVKSALLIGGRLFFVKTDDALYAQGDNYGGALGAGPATSLTSPAYIAASVTSFASGGSHALFVTTDGTAYGMGNNYYGQLGSTQSRRPGPLHLASNIETVSAGLKNSYLLTRDGSLYANTGAPGTKTNSYSYDPTGWQKIATGVDEVSSLDSHVLTIKADGSVHGAGTNSVNQLPGAPTNSSSPTFVSLGTTARQISAASETSLLVKDDNTVWGSGSNYGRFGNGSSAALPRFTQIATNVASLSAGYGHTLFVKTDGILLASGESYYGQSGPNSYGPSNYSYTVLTPNTLATGVKAAAAGGYHTLFSKTDNTLWGLGNNSSGQLGGTITSTVGTAIQIASDVKLFAGGSYSTYYTKSNNELWTLGSNNYGQLGRETSSTNTNTAGRVAANVVALSAGDGHALFVASGDIRLDPPAGPTLTGFTPSALTHGTSVTITGTNLANTSQVLFNDIEAASFTIDSPTQVTAIVPASSLLTTGPVKLATFDGVTTSSGTFTVAWAPSVVTQPVNQSVTNGHDIAFAASASGNPVTGYQWQISTDNGTTWANISNGTAYSGASSDKLTVIGATSAMNGYRYRYSATNSLGSITSNAFTLTVTPIQFPRPVSLAFDSSDNLYVADASAHTIQKLTGTEVSLFAGGTGTTGETNGAGTTARFNEPRGLAFNNGTFVVADTSNSLVRTISSTGTVAALAGASTHRSHQDGTGPSGWFTAPKGVARDSFGTTFVTDSTSHTIRKITSTGVVTTIAGSPGLHGASDGTGTAARFNEPSDIAIDTAGNLYVADSSNHTIRKITFSPTPAVSTLAGLPETPGDSDGMGYDAAFRSPGGLTVDNSGNIYVADTGNALIRKITSAGVVTTIAGVPGIEGMRDGTALDAWFRQPTDIARAADGTLYVADAGNAAIRKIAGDGTVSTINPTQTATPDPGTGGGGGTPSTPPPTTPAAPSGGGGGGGGAPSLWFLAVLALLATMRSKRQ